MNKMKKQKGFIFMSVLALIILITSVAMSTAVLNMTYAREVTEENGRTEIYYIANTGLEIVYAGLNTPQLPDNESIMAKIKKIPKGSDNKFNLTDTNYKLQEKQLEIKIDSKIIGYADVSGDLHIEDFSDNEGKQFQRLYYKIVATGMLHKEKDQNSPQEICTLTMFVFADMPNSPKIYTGNKKIPD